MSVDLYRNTVPVNKMARDVIKDSHIDDKFFSKKSEGASSTLYWEHPKPHIEVSNTAENLIGVKFGRFTVIGKLPGRVWQVRCSCGNYAARRSKSIKNPKNSFDCCEVCRELLWLKRRSAYEQGYELEWKDM